jgi:hypothetical protein
LELVPNQRIRYTNTFDDPSLPGTMEMCYLRWQESLTQLAALVEQDILG